MDDLDFEVGVGKAGIVLLTCMLLILTILSNPPCQKLFWFVWFSGQTVLCEFLLLPLHMCCLVAIHKCLMYGLGQVPEWWLPLRSCMCDQQ